MKSILRLPKSALAVLLCCTMIACSAAQIAALITLIGQLAVNVLTIGSAFNGKPVSPSDLATLAKFTALAQKVNGDVQTAYTNYQADKATQPALIAALQAVETSLPAFLADAQIQNTDLQGRIEAAATAILMSAESIAAFFPRTAPPPPSNVRLKTGRIYRLPPRMKMTPDQIKRFWDANVCQGINSGCTL